MSNNFSVEKDTTSSFTSSHKDGQKVTRFKTLKGVEYPHVELKTDKVEAHLINYLKAVTYAGKFEDIEPDVEGYTIYISLGEQKGRVGVLAKEKFPVLMNRLFDNFERIVRLDEQTEIEGELLYALCPPTV